MTNWICNRLPTEKDADIHGMVLWQPDRPGLLMHWSEVRPGEVWGRSSAWQDPGLKKI
jgi:hypothetical protein